MGSSKGLQSRDYFPKWGQSTGTPQVILQCLGLLTEGSLTILRPEGQREGVLNKAPERKLWEEGHTKDCSQMARRNPTGKKLGNRCLDHTLLLPSLFAQALHQQSTAEARG